MSRLPNFLTVAQVLRSRRGVKGLMYRGCLLKWLDWHPAPDGTHHAVITNEEWQPEDLWLKPETCLEEQFNAYQSS